MAVRWQISFKTLPGRDGLEHDGLVKIYDSTYTGDVIELEPAVNPISITQRQSELITPVISDSGYLRIIDSDIAVQALDELHPLGSLDRPVEFYRDNVITWRGYISPASYTQPWEPAPREIEIPLIGVLDVLASVNITDTGVATQCIATFLDEILTATGHTFTGVLFPRQMLRLQTLYNDVPELRLRLSRYNFLKLNDADYEPDTDWTEFVGDSWYKVLEDICSYFGWTASAQGTILVLSSPRTDISDYALISRTDLAAIENLSLSQLVTTVAYTRTTVSDISYDGIGHRRSIINGRRRITVAATSPDPEGIYPEILYNGEDEFSDSNEFTFDVSPTGVHHTGDIIGRNKVLNIDREHVELRKYEVTDIGTASESYHQVDWNYPESIDDMSGPGAYIVRSFTSGWVKKDGNVVDGSDTEVVKETYIGALRLSANKGTGDDRFKRFLTAVPLAFVRSRAKCCYPAGSCICISADVQASFWKSLENVSGYEIDPTGMSMWGPYTAYLKCALRIGSYWYNGTGWVQSQTPPLFDISCRPEDKKINASDMMTNGVGHIADRVDIKMPAAGTEGYVIPIDTKIEGDMELVFYPWDWSVPGTGSERTGFPDLYISNIRCTYYKGSDAETKDLRITRLTGQPFQDNLDLQLHITSSNDNRLTQSQLWNYSRPVGLVDQIQYPGNLYLLQPEQWLMNTLLMLYSAPATQLILEVDYDSTLQVYDLVSIEDKNYIITGSELDYADEHVRLTLMSYE